MTVIAPSPRAVADRGRGSDPSSTLGDSHRRSRVSTETGAEFPPHSEKEAKKHTTLPFLHSGLPAIEFAWYGEADPVSENIF